MLCTRLERSLSADSLEGVGSKARLFSLLTLGFRVVGFVVFEIEDWRRGLRYAGLGLGLVELTEERLLHVAEAGSLGGGIALYLVGSASNSGFWGFELLRSRATLSRSRREVLDAGAVTLSGSEGVDIWLSRSGAGVRIAL